MAATGRHGARRLLVQALYQHQLGAHGGAEIIGQFGVRPEFALIDRQYFERVLGEILTDTAGLDRAIMVDADRPIAQLDPVERGILWLGTAELLFHREVPVKVVINEAVQLAKEFGAQDSHRYVNALLDRLAATLRPAS